MSKLNINRLTNENEDGSPAVSGISTFSSTAFLEPPKGTTAQRPSDNLQGGMMRFNTDSGHLEYFDGNQWTDILVANNTLDGGARGLFGGAFPASNVIDYITISSTGNALDFGDLTVSRDNISACSSSTRGVWGGGNTAASTPGGANIIDYVTISSIGNAQDFGDLTVVRRDLAACSSSTRGLFGGGYSPTNIIDYITIESTGNAVDFGDLTVARRYLSSTSSSTRGLFAGALPASSVIDYVTISSTGNALNFGNLSVGRSEPSACSSSTRGLFGGGSDAPTQYNIIDYVTIASTGNAQDFGDLTQARRLSGSCSSSTRGVWGGGLTLTNVIDYINISSTGNATDFGDLTVARGSLAACSNGHGGL
jgi:hypothetical protein